MKDIKSIYHGVSVLWDYLAGLPLESWLQGDQLSSLSRENCYWELFSRAQMGLWNDGPSVVSTDEVMNVKSFFKKADQGP